MTLRELYNLYYIEQEIKEYKEKILELRELAENITPKYSGMPSGKRKSDKTGEVATAIVQYTEMLERAIKERVEQSARITEFILSIEDAQVRQIMYLRFINKLTWRQVAQRIGGNNTEDSVRKRCSRYLRENKKLSEMSHQEAV